MKNLYFRVDNNIDLYKVIIFYLFTFVKTSSGCFYWTGHTSLFSLSHSLLSFEQNTPLASVIRAHICFEVEVIFFHILKVELLSFILVTYKQQSLNKICHGFLLDWNELIHKSVL